MKFEFDTVESVLKDIRQGKMVIVTDDENRENEGDLVCAAEKVTPEIINFMITHARGLVCAPITQQRAEELKILLSDLQVATDHAPSELKVAFSSLASEISRTGTLKIEKLPLCVSAVETGLGVFSAFGIAPAGHSNLLEKLKKLAEEQ